MGEEEEKRGKREEVEAEKWERGFGSGGDGRSGSDMRRWWYNR